MSEDFQKRTLPKGAISNDDKELLDSVSNYHILTIDQAIDHAGGFGRF